MADPKPAQRPAAGGVPQYELTEKAYINDRLYEPGDKIYYKGIPGPHMLPLNRAAEEMFVTHNINPNGTDNPIDALTVVGPGAVVLQQNLPGR